ncbi:MAG: TlpA disulfide reductase family protein [Gemmataceae bacterium]
MVARTALLLLVLTMTATAQPPDPADAKMKAALDAYQALVKEHAVALAEYQQAAARAKTPEQKQELFRTRFPHASAYVERFAEVVRRYPTSPVAVEALVWIVTHPTAPDAREATLRPQALDLLQSEYVKDERVGRLCTQLVFSLDPASERFLRTVLEKSPLPAVQARACVSLAANLKHRGRLIRLLKDDAKGVAAQEQVWGKAAIAALVARDPDRLLSEAAKLFQRVVDQYGDTRHPTHGTLGALARANLGAIRAPVDVDRVAPEIDGDDLAGKPLRLSELRGKVVLVDFWGDGFAASRTNYPYERGLVYRLRKKPFVLVGVNADPDRADARAAMQQEKLTWRSWWDGGGVGGPIATRWEIDLWPSLVLIDHQGVVRGIWMGWPESKELDAAIDRLVDAAGRTE